MSEPGRPRFQYGLRTLMFLFIAAASSLAVFGVWGILVFALVLGLAVYLGEKGLQYALTPAFFALLLLGGLIAALLPAVQSARINSHYDACRNNLKQLASALLDYERAHGSFPPAYTVDNNGKPLTSWRMQIFPELDLAWIYKAYDLTKPWDAPQNKAISANRLTCFLCPSDFKASESRIAQSSYFAVVGLNAAWPGDKPRKLADLRNDAPHTVLLVEMADSDIAWAEPEDVSVDQLEASYSKPKAYRLSSGHRPSENFFYTYERFSGVNVALADGSVYFLRTDNLSLKRLRQILEIGGFTDDVVSSQTGLSDSVEQLNWPNIAAVAVWLVSMVALLTSAVRGRAGRAVGD